MSEKADPLDESRTRSLSELERTLDKSRLAKEDTLGKPPRSATEREWVLANRTEEAKHWNLLTDWRPGTSSMPSEPVPNINLPAPWAAGIILVRRVVLEFRPLTNL